MQQLSVAAFLLSSVSILGACGGDDDSTDTPNTPMGGSDAQIVMCDEDSDCNDGSFCNGIEICAPSAQDADLNGCVVVPTCVSESVCDEQHDECVAECDGQPDADGDGHRALTCGGDDCDDSDPRRYPGNTEVCDEDNLDEDCDLSTFGFRDQDGDGWPDAACCNEDTCGTDCDDAVAVIHPTANELCDGLDNDCNGEIDEGVAYGDLPIWYRDSDGDGYGLLTAQVAVCAAEVEGYVRLGGDCDDVDARVHPGAEEFCDRIDNDCDPGTHGCWLQTRSLQPYDLPAVGTEGTQPFRVDCVLFGNAIGWVNFRYDQIGVHAMQAMCGNALPGGTDPMICDYGVGRVLIGGSMSNIGDFSVVDSIVTFPDNAVCLVPAESVVQQEYCQNGESQIIQSVLTEFHFNETSSGLLSVEGYECSPHRFFGDSFAIETGTPIPVGSPGTLSVSCPDGELIAGIHGTLDDNDYLSSFGVICRAVIGVEL